MNRMPLNSQH